PVRVLLRAKPREPALERVAHFIAEGEILLVPGQRFVGGANIDGAEREHGDGEKMEAFHLEGFFAGSSLMLNSTGVPTGGTASFLTNHTWSSFDPVRGLLMSALGRVTTDANAPSACAAK